VCSNAAAAAAAAAAGLRAVDKQNGIYRQTIKPYS